MKIFKKAIETTLEAKHHSELQNGCILMVTLFETN